MYLSHTRISVDWTRDGDFVCWSAKRVKTESSFPCSSLVEASRLCVEQASWIRQAESRFVTAHGIQIPSVGFIASLTSACAF